MINSIIDGTANHIEEIEKLYLLIAKKGQASYIDAIIKYAEMNNIEVEVLGDIIRGNPTMLAKTRIDAMRLNYIKQDANTKSSVTLETFME